ncbi:MAG: GTP cyclohydrolase IIa [Desulfurococcales archaeon]|nr:GTP cyclohydrolase IIa [Desulfurococcales archaeon]
MVIRVAVLELIGYREWTEALGSDREWFIQVTQSELYALTQKIAASHGGHVLPLRYDYMVILASNMTRGSLEKVLYHVSGNSSVPVRMASSCGQTPLEAESRAWDVLRATRPGELTFEECSSEDVAIAHIDINDITSMTREMGASRTYYMVLDLLHRISRKAYRYGAIVQYLGGDNILATLPTNSYRSVVEDLVSEGDNLKAGVGYAPRAREALALAAEALHEIRSERDKTIVYRTVDSGSRSVATEH